MAKITEEDFEYFKTRVNYWIKVLQCYKYSWQVNLVTSLYDSCVARTTFNVKARWASIELIEDWGIYPINKKTLNTTAFMLGD